MLFKASIGKIMKQNGNMKVIQDQCLLCCLRSEYQNLEDAYNIQANIHTVLLEIIYGVELC